MATRFLRRSRYSPIPLRKLSNHDTHTDVRQLAVHRMLSAAMLVAKASKPAGFDADREVERSSQGIGYTARAGLLVQLLLSPTSLTDRCKQETGE